MTREEAIDILFGVIQANSEEENEALDMAIKALEQTRWIPCSERLPEYGEKVLTYDGVTCWVEARIPFVLDEKCEELRAEWWVSDDVDHEERYYPNLRDGAAIAWMPLPEPYGEDGESEV